MIKTRLLVLGLGNVLCEDDGLGVAAIDRLRQQYEVPDGVEVLDGGTLGLSLLPHLMDAETAILVDAVRTDDPPGTAVRLDGGDVLPAAHGRLSPHQIGVADLLDGALLRDSYPSRVVLLGIVPRSIGLGIRLAPEVEAGLSDLVERVVAEAASMGMPFTKREMTQPECGARPAIQAADPLRYRSPAA